jgi:hypothetical protein
MTAQARLKIKKGLLARRRSGKRALQNLGNDLKLLRQI